VSAELLLQLLGLAMVAMFALLLWKAQRAPRRENPFDAAQMFQDSKNRTSGSKFVGMLAGVASVWVVVFLAVTNRAIDPTLFIGWLVALVLGKVGTEAVNKMGGGGANDK
jgi:nicotinamide riboside transporter PnuC